MTDTLSSVIDWPNLLIGCLFGVAGTVPFWLADRRRGRRATRSEWIRAAHRIEVLLWRDPPARGADLHALTGELPIDQWRHALGPDDFRVLERLQNAYSACDHAARENVRAAMSFYQAKSRPAPHPEINVLAFQKRVDPEGFATSPTAHRLQSEIDELRRDPTYAASESDLERTNRTLQETKVAFTNLARQRANEEYSEVLEREHRREAFRHPVREVRQRLRYRRARAAAAKPTGKPE